MSKTYKAKINLPGCNKDRIILQIENNSLGSARFSYKYQDTGEPCPYNCEDEPKFFAEVKIVLSKYKPTDVVILDEVGEFIVCDIRGNRTKHRFNLPAYTELTVMGELLNKMLILKYTEKSKLGGTPYYLVPEKLVHKPEYYFFVSSDGTIHQTFVGRTPLADKFRKSVGNMHKVKVDARTYLKTLKEKLHLTHIN